ncbi:MAG: dienelactone hydrolase family protein [Burkholderiaceae bacterium]
MRIKIQALKAGLAILLCIGASGSNAEKLFESTIEGKSPAVILITGCTGDVIYKGESHYQNKASQLAKAGYNAYIVDPVSQRGLKTCAGKLLPSDAVGDVLEAIDTLKSHPKVDATNLFLLGTSFGGAVAIDTLGNSAAAESLRGVILQYPSCTKNSPWTAAVPTIAFLAEDDNVVSVRDCKYLFGKVEEAGLPITYQVMSAAYHGFDDSRLPAETKYSLGTLGYQKEASEESWKAIHAFLKEHAKNPSRLVPEPN